MANGLIKNKDPLSKIRNIAKVFFAVFMVMAPDANGLVFFFLCNLSYSLSLMSFMI